MQALIVIAYPLGEDRSSSIVAYFTMIRTKREARFNHHFIFLVGHIGS